MTTPQPLFSFEAQPANMRKHLVAPNAARCQRFCGDRRKELLVEPSHLQPGSLRACAPPDLVRDPAGK